MFLERLNGLKLGEQVVYRKPLNSYCKVEHTIVKVVGFSKKRIRVFDGLKTRTVAPENIVRMSKEAPKSEGLIRAIYRDSA